jgi:outer membrane protein
VEFDHDTINRGGWRQRIFLIVVLLAALSRPADAAGLIELYRQAQKADPILLSAYAQNQIAQEAQRQALAGLLPRVAANAAYVHTHQDIISTDNEVFGSGQTDYPTITYGVSLTQPVFRWDSIVGWRQSKASALQAAAQTFLAEQELILRVADLYFRALAAKDQLDFALAEEKAIARHLELAEARLEMGLIPITDLHDARARMASTLALTITARNRLDDALQALTEVTGEPVSSLEVLREDIILTTPMPDDMEAWLAGALEQNPAIELRKWAVEVAEQETRRQRAGHYPFLDLVGSFENRDTDGSLFGGGSEVQTLEVGVHLSVPLYQGGDVASRVRAASQELHIARQELIAQNRSVLRETRAAFLGVNSALRRVDALQQSVLSNQLALEAKQEGFLSGLYTSLGVLDAERDLTLAAIDYAQARYEYIINSLRLKRAAGRLQENDLQGLESWLVK